MAVCALDSYLLTRKGMQQPQQLSSATSGEYTTREHLYILPHAAFSYRCNLGQLRLYIHFVKNDVKNEDN